MRKRIGKKTRTEVYEKFGGRCAYTGNRLKENWQVDHVTSVIAHEFYGSGHMSNNIENLVPAQCIVNHYKRSLSLEQFRQRMASLHVRICKLPKNPRSHASIKRKAYLLSVANEFGINKDTPFCGTFFFEKQEPTNP